MIPYWEPPSLRLPLDMELSVFGVMVVAGVLTGALLAYRAALRYAPGDDHVLRGVTPWAVICGFGGAHLLHVFGYHPELLREQGLVAVLEMWAGMSSTGGVVGALIGIGLYAWKKGIAFRPYLDALALGAAPGWAVARIGCALVHDHPGIRTAFPLAVAYPGGARHDLGLYDIFVLAALSLLLYRLRALRRGQGFLMGVLAIGYAVPRFLLDTLRATDFGYPDGRIWGFTPAQYLVVLFFAAGAYLIATAGRHPTAPLSTSPPAPA